MLPASPAAPWAGKTMQERVDHVITALQAASRAEVKYPISLQSMSRGESRLREIIIWLMIFFEVRPRPEGEKGKSP